MKALTLLFLITIGLLGSASQKCEAETLGTYYRRTLPPTTTMILAPSYRPIVVSHPPRPHRPQWPPITVPPGWGGQPDQDPTTDPNTDPGNEPGIDPTTDPGTDPGNEPGIDPTTDPGTTDPETTNPGTEPPEILALIASTPYTISDVVLHNPRLQETIRRGRAALRRWRETHDPFAYAEYRMTGYIEGLTEELGITGRS